jgi:N-acetylmuramoyl-L-alanine amidase
MRVPVPVPVPVPGAAPPAPAAGPVDLWGEQMTSGWTAQRRHRLRRTLLATTVLAVCAGSAAFVAANGLATSSHPGSAHNATASDAGTAVAAGRFAPGSCLAYPPTAGNRHLTVFLDAGHGGPDPGGRGATSTGTAIDERELTLPTVLDATRLLRAEGFRVVVSRSTSASVTKIAHGDLSSGLWTVQGLHADIAARPLCADLAKAAVLVSLHFNIGSSPANAGTVTTYDAARTFAPQNLALARLLQTDMVKALQGQPGWQVPDDGVVTDDTVGNALTSAASAYGHLLVLGPAKAGYFATPSDMPGALIEPLYLTDPFEGGIAGSARGQHIMAMAIAQAVTTFLAGR